MGQYILTKKNSSSAGGNHASALIRVCLLVVCLLSGRLFAGEAEDVEILRGRFQEWVLGGGGEVYAQPLAVRRLQQVVSDARRALTGVKALPEMGATPALYNTVRKGGDESEVRFLITTALPALSVAYHLQGSQDLANPWHRNPEVLKALMRVFDRLHARGFREPMHLPWKPQQVLKPDPKQAMIVDFILRTSGYALATFLMHDELRESGRLERSLATCWEIESHPEKTGDLRAEYLQADAVRVVLNLSLPAALAEGNVPRLRLLRDQMNRSMMPESNTLDTIKPDGLGHHHRGVYPAGYAAFTMAQGAYAAWLLRDTAFACSQETVANVARGLEVLRLLSQKYDMHMALGGRFSSASVIPDVLLGYAYLTDMPHPRQVEFKRMLARLADADYLAGDLLRRTLTDHRDEVPPGPGCIAHFMDVCRQAGAAGAEPDPTGHWAFNYGPLSVHRRDHWMVSIKGYSRYWWAFERSLTDARKDPRQENVFGFHDGSGSMMIFAKGEPRVTAAASGYSREGWDWCRVPGTTTRHLTPEEMLAGDKLRDAFNRPYSDATFVGGLSLGQRHGLFAMDYAEAAPDQRAKPLKALKSAFFFDDQIVMLTSGIRDGDGQHAVTTTLYQTALADPAAVTYVQGAPATGLQEKPLVIKGQPARLVDAAGNGYFIPSGNRVVVSRSLQVSMNESAMKQTRGHFATAWIDHGTAPEDAGCEYVVLVQSGRDGVEQFAQKAGQEYRVLRRDETAHVVKHLRLGLTGYAVARANAPLRDTLLEQASAPCLVMTQQREAGRMQVSACHPDLGWKKGIQYGNRQSLPGPVPMKPVPTPLVLTFRGSWKLVKQVEGAAFEIDGSFTRVLLNCADAKSLEFEMEEDVKS